MWYASWCRADNGAWVTDPQRFATQAGCEHWAMSLCEHHGDDLADVMVLERVETEETFFSRFENSGAALLFEARILERANARFWARLRMSNDYWPFLARQRDLDEQQT